MPTSTAADSSSVDTLNSTSTPLGSFGTFTGVFVPILDYTSITLNVVASTGTQFAGVRIQWSSDGVNVDTVQSFTYTPQFDPVTFATIGMAFHATVRSKFYRVVYGNGFTVQTFLRLQSLLRKGTPAGTVRNLDPQDLFISSLDAQTSLAVIGTPLLFNSDQIVLPFSRNNDSAGNIPLLMVTTPQLAENVASSIKVASLASQRLDIEITRRRFLTVFNDTTRGNLFVRLDSAASTSNFHWKVPPQHTWHLPPAWGIWGGEVYGVWDVADGNGIVTETKQ